MTKEQTEIVKLVYNRLIENEEENWSEIDDNLEFFGLLSDRDIIKESRIKYKKHSKGTFKCVQNHQQEHCFAPYVLEGVEAILSLYDKTLELHPKNAYILTYYLAMTEMKMVFSV